MTIMMQSCTPVLLWEAMFLAFIFHFFGIPIGFSLLQHIFTFAIFAFGLSVTDAWCNTYLKRNYVKKWSSLTRFEAPIIQQKKETNTEANSYDPISHNISESGSLVEEKQSSLDINKPDQK